MNILVSEFRKRIDIINQQNNHQSPITLLKLLVESQIDNIPLPATGNTLQRWQIISYVASLFDLSAAKLFESHCDAKAIIAELGGVYPANSLWGVWCSEPPHFKVQIDETKPLKANQEIHISGSKAWCSGANELSHALISVWSQQDNYLVAVDLSEPTISIDTSNWHAIGMQQTNSFNVTFNQTKASILGNANDYINRPGFVHGAAGVACCWYGALIQLTEQLKIITQKNPNPYRLAHLGAIDALLAACINLITNTANIIDNNHKHENTQAVIRMRLFIEEVAEQILQRIPRAVGAVPLCLNAKFAQLMADLPVFIRQSHAEQDQASLAALVLKRGREQWML